MVNWFLDKDITSPPSEDAPYPARRLPVLLIASLMTGLIGVILVFAMWPAPLGKLPDAASRWAPPGFWTEMEPLVVYSEGGDALPLSRYDGRPKIVMLYTLDCRRCVASLQTLDATAQTYGGRVDLVAVALVQGDPSTEIGAIRSFLRDRSVRNLNPYGIGHNDVARMARMGLPTTFVIDRDNRIVRLHHGPGDWHTDGVQRLLESLIVVP